MQCKSYLSAYLVFQGGENSYSENNEGGKRGKLTNINPQQKCRLTISNEFEEFPRGLGKWGIEEAYSNPKGKGIYNLRLQYRGRGKEFNFW